MDLISQLQDHTNHVAFILFDTIGTLQRDAQPSPLPGKEATSVPREPQANGVLEEKANGEAGGAQPPAEGGAVPNGPAQPVVNSTDVEARASALIKAVKLFDDMVQALPAEVDQSEEELLRRMEELQRENERVGEELAEELEGAENDRRKVRELFETVASSALNRGAPSSLSCGALATSNSGAPST